MKRFIAVLISFVFALSVFITTGCGGKSQKINGVADEESQVMDEASQASRESLPTTYMVESGDTLWSIAQKAEIYGNKQQWPIIYDANRDILDDYKKPLEEGQKLIIPRNISAVEIESAKERAEEYGMPPGDGSKYAAYSDEEEAEDSQHKVAGMSGGSSDSEGSSSDDSSGYAAADSGEVSEEPTPIPEPVKPRKKGGNNMMMILLALLGVIAVIIFFIISKQKKKEEEEETGESETKTNILD